MSFLRPIQWYNLNIFTNFRKILKFPIYDSISGPGGGGEMIHEKTRRKKTRLSFYMITTYPEPSCGS